MIGWTWLWVFNMVSLCQFVYGNEWTLVFKAVSGGNGSVYDLYTGNGTLNINNPLAQSPSNQILEHFKSDLINHWSDYSILQVRVAVYKDSSEVAYFLFDGIGSNYVDWFSQNRLISSSYADLPPSNASLPINFFSIFGYQPWFVKRSFYVNSEWGGCPIDSGWLSILDVGSVWGCPSWEAIYLSSAPVVLYSPISTRCNYYSMSDILADSMTISVKYDTRNITCQSACSPLSQLGYNRYCFKTCPVDINLEDSIHQIKKELTVNKKNTSLYRRSLTSVYEERPTAKALGFTGIFIIVSVLCLLFVLDCVKFKEHLRYQNDEND